MKTKVIVIFFFLIFCEAKAVDINGRISGTDSIKRQNFRLLQVLSFEDNLLGYTFSSDDKPFVDISLSFRIRIFPFDYVMKVIPVKYRPDLHLHLAYSGRFGQYVSTRYSNPVIEKRFNPYLFLEYSPRKKYRNLSFQFGYGHESNGQAIDDSSTFYITAELPHNSINETKDKISRGWDYVGGNTTVDFFPKKLPKIILQSSLSINYFLDYGILQGSKEEYGPWERDWSGENYTRNEVSGLALMFTCFLDSVFVDKIRFAYETGIARPLMTNSIKILLGFKVGRFPISLTYKYGYNGDLAQYGKLTTTFGIESFIPSFEKPDDRRKRRYNSNDDF